MLKIAVAKPGDSPLAPAQGLKQWVIHAHGLQSPVTTAIVSNWTAERSRQLTQGSARLSAGQRVQVTVIGRTAHLGPAGQVHHGSTQGLPSALRFVVGCDMKLQSVLLGWSNPDQALRVSAGTPRKHASDGLPRKVSGLLSEV
jgi:hypothetical protein